MTIMPVFKNIKSSSLSSRETSKSGRALIVINPVSGIGNSALVRKWLERHFSRLGWEYTLYETDGREDLRQVVRDHLKEKFDLVVAAGGDGTISQVASGMAYSGVPLGVVPLGTWNALARNLGIPMLTEMAIRLLTGHHRIRSLDALEVDGTLYMLNVSIGISSNMVRLTDRKSKQRFGALAYFKNVTLQIFGLIQHPYQLILDGEKLRVRASELMIANSSLIGLGELPTRLNIHPDDGVAEACIMNPRSIFELAMVAWNVLVWRTQRPPPFRCLPVRHSITIIAPRPVNVQGDGEIIGKTPVEIKLAPGAVEMIVPQDELKLIIQRLLQPDSLLKIPPKIDLKQLSQKLPALTQLRQNIFPHDDRNKDL
jgi:diacylglycerol kinase (ATP)